MIRIRHFAYGVAALLLPIPVCAQEPLDAQLFEHVDVSIVNVDVVVLDKRGEPITGLSAEDFIIREDGKPVELTNFYAATVAGGPQPAAPMSAAPEPRANPEPAWPVASEPVASYPVASDPVLMVIYVDNLQLTPHRRNIFLDQIKEVVDDSLRPHDKIMVVSHRHGLRIVESFTNEPTAIARALDSIRDTMGDGILDRSERRLVLGQFRDAIELATATQQDPCSDLYGIMVNAARSYADGARARASQSLQGLFGLTSALAGAPGRKIVLFLSDGIGLYPGFDVFHHLSEICPERATDAIRQGQEVNLIQAFHRLASHANANRITFYPLDATGLDGNSAADAAFAGAVATSSGTHGGVDGSYNVRPSAQNDTIRRSNRQNTLFTLANETGGRAMLNGNDLRVDLEAMNRDARTYYALGFQPAHPHDGRVHRLKVELVVPRKGARLLYRRTYLDKMEEARTAERTLAALRFGFEDNPLEITVETGPPRVDEQGQWTVPLRIALALGQLITVQRDGYYEAQVQVVISAQDEHDRPLEMRQQTIPIRIAQDLIEAARAGQHVVEVAIPMATGESVLAIAVRDTLATTTSFLQHRVHFESSGDLL